MSYAETHVQFKVVRKLRDWEMFVSRTRAKRLIVFVHGFRGKTVATWNQFHKSGQIGQWWQESDMLFVGYKFRESIRSVADALVRELPEFYPIPISAAMQGNGIPARDDTSSPYEELILVGHSLGGVIIRCALVKTVEQWPPGTERPTLLDAQTRLFSPATAGFRPTGLLRLAQELGGMGGVVGIRLRMSTQYLDLQPESRLLLETRRQCEKLYKKTSAPALKASVLWANPDGVVMDEGYKTDIRDSADGKSHLTVCKPHDGYRRPWQFVETGK